MSSEDGFVAQVAAALSRALTPLVDATSSPEALSELLAQLGWDASPSAAVVSAVSRANPALNRLSEDVADDVPATTLVADVAAVMAALGELEEVSLGGTGAPFDNPGFWSALPGELFSLLVWEDIEANKPRLYGFLRFFGVLRVEARPADGATGRLAHDARVIDFAAAGRAAADPSGWLADLYGWGTGFDHAQFLPALAALGAGLGGAVSSQPPHPELVAAYMAPGNPDRGTVRLLSLSPFEVEGPTLETLVKAALLVLALPPADKPSAPPEGVLLWPLVSGAAAATVDLGPTAELTLEGDFQLTPVRIQLRPGGATVESATADLSSALRVDIAPATPFRMAGGAGGPRLELRRAHFGIGIENGEVVIDAALDEASAVLDLAGADSFLRGAFGGGQDSLSLAAGLTWSSASGLAFSGSPRPSLTIPTNIQIAGGALSVTEIMAELAAVDGDGTQLTVSVVGGFELGPFSAWVEHLGLRAIATPASFEAPGNFGLLDLSFGFKPPTGVGFVIDVSDVVTGGGFVNIDPETGRYAGGLALDAFGVGISAIVVVDTAIPGDPDGWALFASLGAGFPTPIPLGFGFTLIGVGGLLALNRTIDVDELASALRTGAADAILFPDDIEEDAQAVLAGLDLWFPIKQGTTVVGPVAEIGWGSPTLISAQLGVVVAIPDLVVTVLGSVEMLLPTPDEAVLTLRMDVIGAVDVPEQTVVVAASIHDSNLLGVFELSGDMGFYSRLTGQPLFVLSVGGYHPQFDPPGCLPGWLLELRRVSASVELGEGVEVVLSSYVAVTSNTVQFGGRVRIIASVEVLLTTYTAEGWFGVNVLLVLKPFTIVARMTAGVAISAGDRELMGVQLTATLKGPQPWYATGRASFTFFGLDVDLAFDVGSQPGGEPREVCDVAEQVARAVSPPAGWEAAPAGDSWGSGVVTAAELPAGLWVRPDQVVEVRQSVAPLNRTITAFGEFAPAADRIDADGVTLGGEPVASPTWLDDWFAPAQFDRLGDTYRLSAPSYELMTAGVRFGDSGVAVSEDLEECASVSREPEESIWPDSGAGRRRTSRYVSPPRRTPGPARSRRVAGKRLKVVPTTYTVVRSSNGQRAGSVLGTGGRGSDLTYADAVALVEQRAAADPGERRRLRVVPSHAAVGPEKA